MKVSELHIGLLFYLVGKHSIDAVLVAQTGERRLFRLAGVDQIWPRLDPLANVLNEPLRFTQSEIARELLDFSRGWGRQLLPPLEALEAFDILIIIPHHFLHFIPFHLIWLGENYQYLGTRFGLSYCSSATLFTRAVSRNLARAGNISTWEFSLNGEASAAAPEPPAFCVSLGLDVLGENDSNYNHLARACAERFQRGQYLNFGRQGLKGPISPNYEVICLVCHGVVDPVYPDNSGLLLASPKGFGSEIKQRLHYGEVYRFRDLPLRDMPPQIQLNQQYEQGGQDAEMMTIREVKLFLETRAQLVMLLGCSTAAGQILSGDNYGSLAYQWLQAGAASVIAHQWEADFRFVSDWTPRFLNHWLTQRQPKAIAMRESLKEIIQTLTSPDDMLQIWGAVTLLGDWL